MSREASQGPVGSSPGTSTGIQTGRQLASRRGNPEPGSTPRGALGSQVPGRNAGQADANANLAGNDGAITDEPVIDTAVISEAVIDDATTESGLGGAVQNGARDADGSQQLRPSLDGGMPALQRELGAHGRETVRRLLQAGLAEFEEAGFQAARVEDIVRRAKTSHGTFYLYFANKDDLFRTLLRDALVDMANITDEFPVVTSNETGRAALRRWIQSFCETYEAHATVIRILSQAEIVGESVFSDGLQLFFRLSEVMTQGMTAAQGISVDADMLTEHAELTAVACLMMLERINYLMSAAEVRLPKEEMIDRLTAIIFAAFRS